MTQPITLQRPATPRHQRPRLGFAGVGWIGRHRLEAIARSNLGEVAAIFDPSIDATEAARAHAPAANVVADFEALLDCDLDGIVIATPSALHTAQAVAALERGLAVFCQKPLGRNREETERAIAAAHDRDRLLHVDLSYRFTRGAQEIHQLIHEGVLGQVYAIEAVFHNAYGPDKPWFYDARLSGGGCLLDLGIHLVDLALWSLDFPEVASVAGQLLHGGRPPNGDRTAVEDYAAAQLALSSGASVQLACSWKAPAGGEAVIRIQWLGTEGGALLTNVAGSFYDFTAEHLLPDRSRRLLAQPPDDWGGRAATEWARRLALSPSFDPSIKHLISVADTLDRIYGRRS